MTTEGIDQGAGADSANMNDVVPKSVFDVSLLPLKPAIAAWKDAVGTGNDVRLSALPEKSLPTRMEGWHMGEIFFGALETVSQEFKRSRHHIGLGGGDCYSVQFCEGGGYNFPVEDRSASPGDLFIRDRGEPFTARVKTIGNGATARMLGYLVPKRLLDPLLASPGAVSSMVLDGRLPLVALLRRHMCATRETLSGMTISEARAIVQPTVELLAAAMNGAAGETNAGAVENALLQEIRRHIDAQIKDPALSPAGVAAAFRISPRKLYQLFEPFGGVVAYIQKKRLDLVHAALIDPAQQHRRIQDIAERHGFMQRKNFNAAFRRAYGITPREARAYAFEGRARNLRCVRESDDLWRWMLDLR